jgi:hypothetical protein
VLPGVPGSNLKKKERSGVVVSLERERVKDFLDFFASYLCYALQITIIRVKIYWQGEEY